MSEFRFLCPQCGRAFKEERNVTECPQCRVPVLTTESRAPTDAENLPQRLDLAALMTRVSADQQPGEDLDAALDRVLRRDYPNAHDSLSQLIHDALDLTQKLWGGTRQEAAHQLAHNVSELELQPEGKPIVKTFQKGFAFRGTDLTPEQQEAVEKEVEEAIRTGKPIQQVQIDLTAGNRRVGCSLLVLSGVVLAVAGRAVFGQ